MTLFSGKYATDFDIQALADNELSWEDAKEVLLYLETNPSAMKRYKELLEQKDLLKKWAGKI